MANRTPRFRTGIQTAGKLTTQQQLIVKNDQVGNTHIKNMQGTTRTLYHFLPLDGRRQYYFFKELNKFSFPFTNIDQNRLLAGETMALQRAYLVYMVIDPVTGGVTTLTSIDTAPGAVAPAIYSGIWNFVQANQNITKDIFVGGFNSQFNRASKFLSHSVYHFDVNTTLLENVDFWSTLVTGVIPTVANGYLGLVIEGLGSILNLKTNA